MIARDLVTLVDKRDFRSLFIDELGWNNPDQPDAEFAAGERLIRLHQVAGYKGLRIWVCDEVPDRKTQRLVDDFIGRTSHERLVIFADSSRQEWRWPRRAQLGGANAKLLVHRHHVGDVDPHLEQQLESIALDFDADISLVELLSKMRRAFDAEAETASVEAARLMKTLYDELAIAGAEPNDATLLLARLLFLFFGDDSGMWTGGMFHNFIATATTAESLHQQLGALFLILDTDERKRDLPPGSPLSQFRYVNGGLFHDPMTIVPLTSGFRDAVLKACEFDWAVISPAIFGSMFQTVKDKDARRHGGEHYTTEENILKTIGPLFLDELHERLASAWDDRSQLTRLHNDLGKLRVLDPAAGCGNFLVVSLRELRSLELDILKRKRELDIAENRATVSGRGQLSFDVTGDVQVTLDHFFGIEIEEWPARIAETALLLIDHLSNQRMEQDFGDAPDRLPIRIAPTIHHGNALETDWRRLLPADENVIIVGNPPFIGQYTKTPTQAAETRRIWGTRWNGYLDYVTCWYAKAVDYYGTLSGRWAFVSTNSISQGEAVEFLWRPILEAGWRCRFAHRSFQWVTEATGGAAVHVSIIGFDKLTTPKPALWTYPEGGKGAPTLRIVGRINPYLADAPNVLVSSRTKPLSPTLSPITYGSKPTDDGNFFLTAADLLEIESDEVAKRFVRRFVNARELLYDTPKHCLWLATATSTEISSSPFLTARVEAVREMRKASKKLDTQRKASIAHLFDQIRQPNTSYLAIPRHVGEQRQYFTAARYSKDVICGDANFLIEDPDGFSLGVLSSSMFIAWMRIVGGRLESRLRFSTFTYNSFPMPEINQRQRGAIIEAAQYLVAVRRAHEGESLATMYEPGQMADDIRYAHERLDRLIDPIFSTGKLADVDARGKVLFRHYAKLTGQETLFDALP